MTSSKPQVVVVTGASGGTGRASAQAFGARGAKVALLARGELGLQGAAKEVEAAGGTALPIPVDIADYEQIERAADRVEQELGPIDVWVNVAFTSVFAPFMQTKPQEYRRVTEVSYLGYVYATRGGCGLRGRSPEAPRVLVGGSTVGTLIANKFVPGILGRYLAQTGYQSQQTDQPRDPDQPVNLSEPADGAQGRDFDTHGIFDAVSTSRSYQLWASQHHGLLGAVGAGAALLGLLVARASTKD